MPDEMPNATQAAADQVSAPTHGLPGMKIPEGAGALHDRSLGAVMGGAVTFGGVHLVSHLTGTSMTPDQVLSVGVAGAGFGAVLASYVPAQYRALLQSGLLFVLALAGAVTLSGCAVTLSRTTFAPSTDAGKPVSTDSMEMEPLARSGRDVFTLKFLSAGVWYATSDVTANGMPTLNARWLEAETTRSPGFPAGTVVPRVETESHLDAATGAHIGDTLSIGTPATVGPTAP